jgi:hypothetical protein
VRSRKKIPCLILDNADHHSIAFQERVFQYARSIYESELCIVIIPITDKTSWQLSRQGALQSFESDILYLPTPRPYRVIERRISFLLKKLDLVKGKQSSDYFFGRNIRLDIKNISAFAASLNRIFVEAKTTSDWLGGLANYDIRRLLELTRDVIASPHIPLEELLKAHISGDALNIPEWKIKNAILRRKYDIYPQGEHPFVQNVYCLNDDIPTTPLLALRILQFLRDAGVRSTSSERDFIPVEDVYNHMAAIAVDKRVITIWLQALLRSGLVLDYDPTVSEVDEVSKLELAPSGKVHLIWGTADYSYLLAMKDVTPIRDKNAFLDLETQMHSSNRDWAKGISSFVDYLLAEDAKWVTMPDHRAFDGQRSVVRRLQRVRSNFPRQYYRNPPGIAISRSDRPQC